MDYQIMGILIVGALALMTFAWVWLLTKDIKVAVFIVVLSSSVGAGLLYTDHIINCETFNPTRCE